MTLHDELANDLQHNRVTRRQVLWLLGAGAAGIADHDTLKRRRVGLVALERIPVRDGTPLESFEGVAIGQVTSGLLGPTADRPIAMAYVATAYAEPGTT